MALWIDRYRPHQLSELEVHPAANSLLLSIGSSYSFPHLLFCGPPGSGKKTRVMAFLRHLFKSDIERMRTEYRTIEVGEKSLEVQVSSSPFHVELTPSDSGLNDRHVISFFLKEIAASECVGGVPVKVVVINEAHRLSRLAQQALRRTMEKYARSCRIILVCESLSQIIEPVRSRCLIVRTPRVDPVSVKSVLSRVCQSENLALDDNLINDVVSKSEGNLRRGLILCELLSLQKGGAKSASQVIPEWEKYIEELCRVVTEDQHTPDMIKSVRNHLYELLVHCIPPTEIFRRLTAGLLSRVDVSLCPTVCDFAASYESRLQFGSKPIFHLEAFLAKFICIYQQYQSDVKSD